MWRFPADPADHSVSQHLNPGNVSVGQIGVENSPGSQSATSSSKSGQKPGSCQRRWYYLSVGFYSRCDFQSQVSWLLEYLVDVMVSTGRKPTNKSLSAGVRLRCFELQLPVCTGRRPGDPICTGTWASLYPELFMRTLSIAKILS